MSLHGHNGGPPLVEEDEAGDVRMRYVRFHISDFLNGIRKLPMDARGFYVTGLLCMYDNMGHLPADDRMAALQMGCDLKTYRRFRAMMLDPKAFGDGRTRWTQTDSGFSQDRVQSEIVEYCREFKNRRDAALRREEDKRQRRHLSTVVSTSSEDGGISNVHLGASKTEETFASNNEMMHVNSSDLSKNINSINEGVTTAVPQPYQTSDQSQTRYPLSHKHKPIEEREEKSQFNYGANAPPPDAPAMRTDVEIIPPNRASSNDSIEAFQAYNELAQRIGLPIARSLTPARRRALDARLREHGGLPAWAQILANVERSAFLRGMGGGRAGWRADFDFLIQAKSCAKVFDGGYGNGAHAASSGETAIERTVRLCEEAADRLGISKGGLL